MIIKIDDTLALQFLEEIHAKQLYDLIDSNRTHLRQWLPWVDSMVTVENVADYILHCKKQFDEGTDFGFCIMYENKMAGRTGIHRINRQNRIGEIGYWLADVLQGKGIVTKCCQALIHFGFTELGLNRIVIKCAVGNDKSRAVAEKLGFKQEGILRQAEWVNGKFLDLYQYSLLKQEWIEVSL